MTPHQIRALRTALRESVEVFGARFHRSGRAVEDWEQGRRRPDPMVLAAMTTVAKRRKIVLDADTAVP